MSTVTKRIGALAAVLLVAGVIEGGIRAEQSLHVGAYYRELGVEQREMNPIERAFTSVFLAAGERLQKQKRQPHSSLPPFHHYGNC